MMQVADSTLGDVVTQITQALRLAVEAATVLRMRRTMRALLSLLPEFSTKWYRSPTRVIRDSSCLAAARGQFNPLR